MSRTSKADAIRRARELRQLLGNVISELEHAGPPTRPLQPQASLIFERARAFERAIMTLDEKGVPDGQQEP